MMMRPVVGSGAQRSQGRSEAQNLHDTLLVLDSDEADTNATHDIRVVLVLPADTEDQSGVELIHQLRQAGLIIDAEKSPDGEDLYVGLHAPADLLMLQAERMHMRLPLRSSYDDNETGMPTHRVFSRAEQGRFAQWDAATVTIRFSTLQRQRLVFSLIEAEPRLGGCGINLVRLCTEHVIKQFFAVHSPEAARLSGRLFRFGHFSDDRPPSVHELCHYLGEQCAMYFAWIQHYTRFLKWLAPAACFVSVHQLYFGFANPHARLLLLGYTLLLSVWSAAELKCWKRHAAALCFEWGVEEFRHEEPARRPH